MLCRTNRAMLVVFAVLWSGDTPLVKKAKQGMKDCMHALCNPRETWGTAATRVGVLGVGVATMDLADTMNPLDGTTAFDG
jgi:hypothetical protein